MRDVTLNQPPSVRMCRPGGGPEKAHRREREREAFFQEKKLHLKSIIHELLWFLNGDKKIKKLQKNGRINS